MDLRLEVRDGAADVPRARHALTRSITEEGLRTDVDSAQLVLTELLTNALLHGTPPIVVRATDRRGAVRIEVCDGAVADVPHRVQAGPTSSTGRGLFLVSVLAARWGVDTLPGGKVVWAELGGTNGAAPDGHRAALDQDDSVTSPAG